MSENMKDAILGVAIVLLFGLGIALKMGWVT